MKHEHIFNMLDISTAHITRETNDWLISHGPDDPNCIVPVVYYEKYGYGFFIVVPCDQEEFDFAMQELPDDLKALLELARLKECEWIMLDRDSNVWPNLPRYEW